MRHYIPEDPDSTESEFHYAVIYAPKRKRHRFSAGCVEIMATLDQVVSSADPASDRFAAKVVGPSKSSEGQCIYYLLQWL